MRLGALRSATPTAVGDYELIRRLESARGELYQARKPDGSEYTLAFVDLPRGLKAQVYGEVWRCRRLSHHGILRVIEAMSHGERIVLVFESVAGMSLLRLMRCLDDEGERLADRALFHVGHTLLSALAEAHAAEGDEGGALVHGELGPHQVLVSWQGEVKLLGFGMGPLFEAARGETPAWLHPFVAPEVRRRRPLTPISNLYSAAAVLWSLLARRAPPPGSRRPAPLARLRPDLDEVLCKAIDRALEPLPTRRGTMRDLIAAFERLVAPRDVDELRWNMELVRASHPFEDDDVGNTARSLADQSWRPRPSLAPLMTEEADDDDPTREMVLPKWLLGEGSPPDKPRSVSGVRPSAAPPRAEPAPITARSPVSHTAAASKPPAPKESAGAPSAPKPPASKSPRASSAPKSSPPRLSRSSSTSYGESVEVVLDFDSTPPPPPVRASAVRPAARAPERAAPVPSASLAPPSSRPAPTSSYPAPPSSYPAPSSAPSASLAPPSIAPSLPPLPPSVTVRPSGGWLGAVAVIAIVSFAGGLVASQLGVSLTLWRPAEHTALTPPGEVAPNVASAAPIAPAPVEPAPPVAETAEADETTDDATSEDAADPTSEDPTSDDPTSDDPTSDVPTSDDPTSDDPTSDDPASTDPTSEDPASASKGDEPSEDVAASQLPPDRGLLRVRFTGEPGSVYVNGRVVGETGELVEVECGMRFVRIGDVPLRRWSTRGDPVRILCRKVTDVTLHPSEGSNEVPIFGDPYASTPLPTRR